ncbi:MAG: lipid-A-disaccharide synthase [Pontibacterium sp.]
MTVAMVAGEASGDILGAGLIEQLRQQFPNRQVRFIGIAGPLMQAQGCESLYPMERLSVMGLVEVLGRLRELLKMRKQLAKQLIDCQPDVFIGIDAPDFNIGLEQMLKDAGVKTVHYVSPSVWAWRRKRVHKIKAATDLMLTLFPFEARFYQEQNHPVTFVGHPLVGIISGAESQAQARESLSLAQDATLVALLPGSRRAEVALLAPEFIATAKWLLAKKPDLQFILPAANEARLEQLEALLVEQSLPIKVVLGQSRTAMAASDAILIASGTATLEATLLKRPMVVAYKLSPISFFILRRMVKSPYISLPNLLADQEMVPEVLQNDVTPEVLGPLVLSALEDADTRAKLAERFTAIYQDLDQNADLKAAQAVAQLISAHP